MTRYIASSGIAAFDEAIYQAERRASLARRQAQEDAEWREYARHHRPA